MLTIEINQTKASRIWLTTAGRRHYPHDKPAITHWLPNGQKHYESYRLNNQYHRINDKPAITYWYGNGQRYRELCYMNGIQYTPRDPTC